MGCNSMFSLCSACYSRSARVFTICVKDNYKVLSDTGYFQNLKTCDQFSCCRFLICENCLLKLNIFEKISLGCWPRTPFHLDAYHRMQDLPSPPEDVPEAHSPRTNCSCETCRRSFGGLNLLADVVENIEKRNSPEHRGEESGSQSNVFEEKSQIIASQEGESKSGTKRPSSNVEIEEATDPTRSKRFRVSEERYVEEREQKLTEETDITSAIRVKDLQTMSMSEERGFSTMYAEEKMFAPKYREESGFDLRITEEKKVHTIRFSDEREIRSKFKVEKGFLSKFSLEKTIQPRKLSEEAPTTSQFTAARDITPKSEIQTIQYSEEKRLESIQISEEKQFGLKPIEEKDQPTHSIFLNEPSTSSGIRGTISPKSPKIMNCEHCSKSFTHRGDLNKHLRSHTGEQPYECHVCQRKFTHTSNLARHLRVHSGDRPFHCDRCNRDFGRKDKLIMHQKTRLCMKLSQQRPDKE